MVKYILMRHNNDIIKVCRCGKTIMTWETTCSNCNKVNI